MIDPATLILVFFLYMGLLFSVALWVERRTAAGKAVADNGVIYALSLAVYCTAWTFYGSVGVAAARGPLFLTIYLGPTLGIALWWIVLRRMVTIKRQHHITSIADFISVRYGKSHMVAAVVTVMVIIGIVPYVALQIKAVISTFSLITGAGGGESGIHYSHLVMIGVLALFTIIFGIRHLDPTERHPGMVSALAAESLVKLLAFLAAGLFVSYVLFDGIQDIFRRFAQTLDGNTAPFSWEGRQPLITWFSYLVLSCSAILFLPRQFHVTVVEIYHERHIRTAMWLFPLYMLLINLFVMPVALAGLLQGYPPEKADTFLLLLPFAADQPLLSTLVFLGGMSAATGMIMVETVTMSTMTTNHLLLPLIERVAVIGFLRRYLLQCRWLAALALLALGYLFERTVGESYMLVNIGMISFVAVFQFAPAVIGGIFWRQGNRQGVVLGLCSGFLVWAYTLILPAFARNGWLPESFLLDGPLGFDLLRPEMLFGITGLDPISNATLWSMSVNLGCYVVGSLATEQGELERGLAGEFVASAIPAALARGETVGRLILELEPKR
jgi:Na+/proline symporter